MADDRAPGPPPDLSPEVRSAILRRMYARDAQRRLRRAAISASASSALQAAVARRHRGWG